MGPLWGEWAQELWKHFSHLSPGTSLLLCCPLLAVPWQLPESVAAGLSLVSEPWGSNGVCGPLGKVPSAERAAALQEKWPLFPPICLWHSKLDPPTPRFLGLPPEHLFGGLVTPGLWGTRQPRASSWHVTGTAVSLCPAAPGPPSFGDDVLFLPSPPSARGKPVFQTVSLESRKPGTWPPGLGSTLSLCRVRPHRPVVSCLFAQFVLTWTGRGWRGGRAGGVTPGLSMGRRGLADPCRPSFQGLPCHLWGNSDYQAGFPIIPRSKLNWPLGTLFMLLPARM